MHRGFGVAAGELAEVVQRWEDATLAGGAQLAQFQRDWNADFVQMVRRSVSSHDLSVALASHLSAALPFTYLLARHSDRASMLT